MLRSYFRMKRVNFWSRKRLENSKERALSSLPRSSWRRNRTTKPFPPKAATYFLQCADSPLRQYRREKIYLSKFPPAVVPQQTLSPQWTTTFSHLWLVRFPPVVLLPVTDLAQLVEQKNAPALGPANGLHYPDGAGGTLELLDEHSVLGRQDEGAGPEAAPEEHKISYDEQIKSCQYRAAAPAGFSVLKAP